MGRHVGHDMGSQLGFQVVVLCGRATLGQANSQPPPPLEGPPRCPYHGRRWMPPHGGPRGGPHGGPHGGSRGGSRHVVGDVSTWWRSTSSHVVAHVVAHVVRSPRGSPRGGHVVAHPRGGPRGDTL